MKRAPGRPPLDEDDPSVPVCVTLPSKKFDALYEQAKRQDLSIPEVIRRLLYGNAYTPTEKKSNK